MVNYLLFFVFAYKDRYQIWCGDGGSGSVCVRGECSISFVITKFVFCVRDGMSRVGDSSWFGPDLTKNCLCK